MLTINTDRNRISNHLKAAVNVSSDENVYAYEVRATKTGQPYKKGTGYCLLADDISVSAGVVTLSTPAKSFSFDIEFAELDSDGDYRISVYVMNKDGVWNDTCQLYTSSGEAVKGSDGRYIFAKRNGSGTDESYVSAYSGNVIDSFITEVLS